MLILGAGGVEAMRMLGGAEAKYETDFSQVPYEIGEFKGEDRSTDDAIFSYLGADAMAERVYTRQGREVHVSLIYGTDWRSIHAPTGCYPAQGWHIVHNRTVEIPAPADSPHAGPIEARVIEASKGEAFDLAMFVYARPNATTSDWTAHGWRVDPEDEA